MSNVTIQVFQTDLCFLLFVDVYGPNLPAELGCDPKRKTDTKYLTD